MPIGKVSRPLLLRRVDRTTLEQRDPRPASFHSRRLTRHTEVLAIITCLDKCWDLVCAVFRLDGAGVLVNAEGARSRKR